MQYIPGSSVTLSASLSYLARHQPLPDDSNVQTDIPQICVDYLSHEWLEEDVWKSWRNMTRHKNEVANGVRLENASWRTWWKQRNNLKTVSPETLNWLKDSDVTWLYGPLHSAAEPVPPPKQSTTEERLNLVASSGKKPILKHRTVAELLNINVPADHTVPSVGSPALEAVALDLPSETHSREDSPRPGLPHTKSDSHIVRRSSSGRATPPRVVPVNSGTLDGSSMSRSMSPADSDGLGHSGSNSALNPPAKRHISFNTFVEQCISIEDPSAAPPVSSIYDSDDELVYDEPDDDDSSASSILEMHAAPAVTSRRSGERSTTPMLRSNSTSQERERMTIAPIPPTLLKTSEEFPAPSPQVIYAPPKEFTWEPPTTAEIPSSSESTSSDSISVGSGSITGQPLDLGFVAPQWGRPTPAVGSVGKGITGPVGPADYFQSDVYTAAGYEEPSKAVIPTSESPRGIGMLAGRSKWVPGSAFPEEDEDEDNEPAEDSSDAGEEEASPEAEGPDSSVGADYVSAAKSTPTIISGSSSTTSNSRTVIAASPPVVRSPPSSVRSGSSRGASQPGKGILKKATGGSGPGSIGSHQSSDVADELPGAPRHSNPIGIPKASLSHPPLANGLATHMPPTATMSSPSPNPSSAAFLSPSQENGPFFGSAPSVPPAPISRGRASTRSASSSGISDRSRSSSKAGTSSPIGSVSPSGYGSPSGSRAGSVLGNRRSSTDVGRTVVAGVPTNGRSASLLARQSSTSPPAVSSPLANSIAASSLGTIVANVPLQMNSPPENGGPPLSRSGMLNVVTRPKLGSRSNSSSSVASSRSSGSSDTANATKTPKEDVKIVLPAPASASAPLPVQAVRRHSPTSGPKPPMPNGEPRPTVVIGPKAAPSSQSSSAGQSPSGNTSMSLEARDRRLDEEMAKVRSSELDSDAEERDNGTFVEDYKSSNPTPSNTPILGLSKAALPNNSSKPSSPSPVVQPSPSSSHPSPPIRRNSSGSSSATKLNPVTQPTTTAPVVTADENGIVGKAADTIVSSAKGLLGAIWGMGEGANAGGPGSGSAK